ncbi:hypothetical protein HOD20_05745 [archaeon]|nr:hypothetical protein [archaeon]MBT4646912.1 hypothetical protein [archaeon]MBT6820890.1 hypothetical protein [archaeon]MBT7391200.1 hypothetical protein [archaeon]
MRQIIISDSHTSQNIDFIYNFIRDSLLKKIKIDFIVLNGDILGEDKARPGYGYKYDKEMFLFNFKKNELLQKLVPEIAQGIIKYKEIYKNNGQFSDDEQIELAKLIKSYIQTRYDFLYSTLKKFSELVPTLYNLGTYESPIHYKTINELAFLMNLKPTLLKKIALLENYRFVYHDFIKKIKGLEGKKFRNISGNAILIKNVILAGIPGFHDSSVPMDSQSELQEKMTKDLLDSIKRQLTYADHLIIYNHCDCKKMKNPFSIRPGSPLIRQFIGEMKGKLKHKIFIQSYNHWVTTHFYERDEFNFILNNTAVNNCIFNIVEVSNKIRCFDVDPKQNRVRELNKYDSFTAEYTTSEQRLALNYKNPDEIIEQRNLKGCYYM